MLKNAEMRAKYEREDVETVLQEIDRSEDSTRLRTQHYEQLYAARSGSATAAASG